jgi:aldose 1-epimerase
MKGLESYQLINSSGMEMSVLNLGGIVHKLSVPINGEKRNVILGFSDLEKYLHPHPYFGALIGRVANRIKHGSFLIGERSYQSSINEGPHTLHGGLKGFDKKILNVEGLKSNSITFSGFSPDGDEGFPGNLSFSLTYTLTDENEWIIEYFAESDRKTIINLTQHSYFNLDGEGTILDHKLRIISDFITEVDQDLIPTGRVLPIQGTEYDFLDSRKIIFPDYDHNYVLRGKGFKLAAQLLSSAEDILLEVSTSEPGLQLYVGRFLDGSLSDEDFIFTKNSALCLETQHFPDAIHHQHFPSILLQPHTPYRSKTIYHFKSGQQIPTQS